MAERDALGGAPPDPELLAHRAAAGVRTMGGALVGRLLTAALARGADVLASVPVTGLDRHDTGWTVDSGGTSIRAGAVVLASGGFGRNPVLRKAFLPYPVTPTIAPSNTGDGLILGLRAGAAARNTTSPEVRTRSSLRAAVCSEIPARRAISS